MTQQILDTGEGLHKQLDRLVAIVQQSNVDSTLMELPDGSLGVVQARADGEHELVPLGLDALNAELMEWIVPMRVTGANPSTSAETSLPDRLVKAYMQRRRWDGIGKLKRLAPAPVIRPDWTIRWTAGFDVSSHVFVTREVQPLPPTVTEEEMHKARSLLSWLFRQFALVHRSSRADCVALMLTPLIVDVIPHEPIPAGVFKADKPGSGKTRLAELISLIAVGERVTIRDLPPGQEMMKSIGAILRTGSTPVALFDNVKSDLSNSALEALLTARKMSNRLLGVSVDIELINDTLWLFSVNAPSVSTDMLRRCVFISLSPDKADTQDPWTGGPIAYVEKNIDMFRSALITLVQWWVQQGRKPGRAVMSGFEEWSKIISGILEAANIPGFLEANETSKDEVHTEADDDYVILERLHRLVTACGDPKDNGWWTGAMMEDWIHNPYNGTDPNAIVLQQWARGSGGTMNARTLGRKLSTLKGRVINGATLEYELRKANKGWYHVELTDPEPVKARTPVNALML